MSNTKSAISKTHRISRFDLLQLHRFKEYWLTWHVSQDKTLPATECRALEGYLRGMGLGAEVQGIKTAYKKNEMAGMSFLNRLVKSGVLPV